MEGTPEQCDMEEMGLILSPLIGYYDILPDHHHSNFFEDMEPFLNNCNMDKGQPIQRLVQKCQFVNGLLFPLDRLIMVPKNMDLRRSGASPQPLIVYGPLVVPWSLLQPIKQT
jgi:hypothetical protein